MKSSQQHVIEAKVWERLGQVRPLVEQHQVAGVPWYAWDAEERRLFELAIKRFAWRFGLAVLQTDQRGNGHHTTYFVMRDKMLPRRCAGTRGRGRKLAKARRAQTRHAVAVWAWYASGRAVAEAPLSVRMQLGPYRRRRGPKGQRDGFTDRNARAERRGKIEVASTATPSWGYVALVKVFRVGPAFVDIRVRMEDGFCRTARLGLDGVDDESSWAAEPSAVIALVNAWRKRRGMPPVDRPELDA
jgi:hypothetical protein